MMDNIWRLGAMALAMAGLSQTVHAAGLAWSVDEQGISVTEDGEEILFYQKSNRSKDGSHTRAHYVHPLVDLDGNVITEDFPEDHLHHRGVFWAWHQFRIGNQPIGDGWMTRRFAWKVRDLVVSDHSDGSVLIVADVDWTSPDWHDGQRAVAKESTSIRIHPTDDDQRSIDFEIKIRANQPSTSIGGSEDKKGYGGFSIRLKMPDDLRFISQNGPQTPQTVAVSASPWMSMIGTQGQTGLTGVTVMCHPSSLGYPQPWILRSKRSMQNPVWPGRDPYLLPDDRWTRLQYRLVLHRGNVESDVINRWYRDYVFGTQ